MRLSIWPYHNHFPLLAINASSYPEPFCPIITDDDTWDELKIKPFPGRLNLIISRDPKFDAIGGIICESFFEALDIAREHAADDGADEICVIGGANVYEQPLPKADRLYVSHVHADVEGDAHFPVIDPAVWQVTSEESFTKTENDDHDFTLRVYDRVKK